MIEQLISLLRQNEISLDDREISDILWLARVLPHTITEEHPSKSPTSSTPNDLQPGSTPRQPESISATKSNPVKPSIYTSGSSTTGDGVRASRVRLPAATALPDAPAISRAFRPFARRYKSGRFRTLDIEKTVQRTAETRFLHPVFQALPERWFDVALVVEDTSTMAVWQQTIHEMAILLERQGSFRDVRLWRLQCNDKKITVRESSGVGRAPEAINDPSGRRLIMMLSDCSSRAWRDGTLAKVILNWAVSMPVLVVHLLSEKLWRHTATGVPDSSVRSSLPGQPNALLTVELPWWGKEEGKNYIPLPLVALNSDHIGQWAGMVMKPGLIYDKAILLTTSSGAIESPVLPAEETLEPEQREQRFRAFVSPETYALAIYLSVTPTPLSLPLIRLVQSAMLPHPRQEQIAELLLGGIIRRKTPIDDSWLPDEVEYEFIDGIKEILERCIFRTELDRVFRCVSVFLERSTGTTFDFIALLENPAGEERVPEAVLPFTRIVRSTLRRLGISYEPATSSQTYSQDLDAPQEKPFAEMERGKELISYVDNALRLVEEVQSNPAEADTSGRLGVFSLPFSRNKAFIGRDDILKDIHKNFNAGERAQALSGMPGVGKTQIALEYAYRYQENYQVVLWVNGHSRESLVSDFVAMAGLLKLAEIHVRDQVETISAVKRWFENNGGWLLILDNADDLAIVREFIPSRETGHVLLTTRAQNTKPIAARQAVEGMGPQESALYLLRRLRIIKKEESLESAPEEFRNKAEALSKALDNLPLALDQAAAFIGEMFSTLEEYQSLYQRARKELLRRRGKLPKYHPSVTVTFLLAFQKVADANPAAADLLRVCAFLEADSIPEEIFSEGAKELGVALASAAESPLALTDSIGEATRFSLLWYYPEARTFSLHRLVQAVLKDEMDESSRRVWAERAVRAVNKAFPTSEYSNWQACSRLIQHAQSLARAIDEFRFEFPEAARMLNQAGEYLNERAQFANAEPLFRRALAIREKVFGIEHESVASSLNNLAGLYYNLGTYAEAESTWSRALTIMENAFGNEDMRVATVLNNLAELYKKQGRYVQAEPLYHQSLAIYQNTLGDEHQRVAVSFNNLAALYLQQGKYAEAEPLLKRALDIKEKLLGSEHPDVATSLNDLAVLYYSRGRYAEAEPLSKRALDIRENAFGAAHPEVANSLNTMAELYRKQGNYAEAESLDRRALDIREKTLSADHPDVATSLNNLALSCSSQRRYAEAERLYRHALDIREKALGAEHSEVANSLENLAGLYFNQGKYAEAEPLLTRALDAREKALGPEHPDTASSFNNLAELYRAQRRYTEAEPLFKRALNICEKALGPKHPSTANSLNNLALLYDSQGRYEEAEPLFKRALDVREKALGPEHPDTAMSLNNLAELYGAQGRYEEAEPLLTRALDAREKALGPEHPDTAMSLNNLALLYDLQGRYEEAEPLFKRALNICEKALGAEHPSTANSLNNLALLYDSQGRYAEAEPLFKRALNICEKALGPKHPSTANSLNNLAGLYHSQGRYAEAELLYKRALEVTEKALGPEHPSIATNLNNLAGLYDSQGRYEEAEPLFKRALDTREKALGSEHPRTITALKNHAALLRKMSREDDVGHITAQGWIDRVIRPSLQSLRGIEYLLAQQKIWTWRHQGGGALERIPATERLVDPPAKDSLEHFVERHPDVQAMMALYDRRKDELLAMCRHLQRAIEDSKELRSLYERVKTDGPVADGDAICRELETFTETERLQSLAESIVNRRHKESFDYTFRHLWSRYYDEFLALRDIPDIRPESERVDQAGDEILETVRELISLLKEIGKHLAEKHNAFF